MTIMRHTNDKNDRFTIKQMISNIKIRKADLEIKKEERNR